MFLFGSCDRMALARATVVTYGSLLSCVAFAWQLSMAAFAEMASCTLEADMACWNLLQEAQGWQGALLLARTERQLNIALAAMLT